MPSLKKRIRKFLPDWLIIIRRLWQQRLYPNFLIPRTFNDKVVRRMMFDRRSMFTQLADKAGVRSYVEPRLGSHILTKLYHVTDRPETIPFDELPNKFVVKPTHGSGWVHLVEDKLKLDRNELISKCKSWLEQSYYELTREWVYKYIKPQIIVEEFIDDGNSGSPNDYKLFVFDGVVEFIQVDAGRFTGHRRRLYSPAWEKLDVILHFDDIDGDVPHPPHLRNMIAAAETLGNGIDFVRADFYDTPEKLYFGELTMMPGCGFERFRPNEFDRYLGSRWKLPTRRRSKDQKDLFFRLNDALSLAKNSESNR